jgi:hypothetical protein
VLGDRTGSLRETATERFRANTLLSAVIRHERLRNHGKVERCGINKATVSKL